MIGSRTISVSLAGLSLVVFCVIALYVTSARTFRAILFTGQGWLCHQLAGAVYLTGSVPAAVQWQALAVRGYEKAGENFDGVAFSAQTYDGLVLLTRFYIRGGDYKNALLTVSRMEDLLRSREASATPSLWRRAMGGLLIYHARIAERQKDFKEAAQKYLEAQANCLSVTGDDSDPVLANLRAVVDKELPGVLAHLSDTQSSLR